MENYIINYKCPKCHFRNLIADTSMVLLSNPPQWNVHCECGYKSSKQIRFCRPMQSNLTYEAIDEVMEFVEELRDAKKMTNAQDCMFLDWAIYNRDLLKRRGVNRG